MRLDLFVEGPLWRFVFVVFSMAIAARLAFFFYAILARARNKDSRWGWALVSLIRSLLPFHSGVKKRPLYALLRYAYHVCLVVVPVFLFGHVAQWEQSRFEWSWNTIPDIWADRLTVLLLGLSVFFLLRHILVPDIRRSSSPADFLLIFVASLPFLTGYLLAHGMPGSLPFLQKNMWTLHVLSAEVMLISSSFLFCRTRLTEEKCTGCAACVLSCPTGTLEATDWGVHRIFSYSHYQCICCGSCVGSCPEDAAELRHEVSLRRIFPTPPKLQIRSVRLEACEKCSALFVPEPQLREVLTAIKDDYARLCPKCRRIGFSNIVSGLALSKKRPKVETHRTVETM